MIRGVRTVFRRVGRQYFVWVLTAAYFAANLLFLTRFPFVHSDEAWLSGLSRNIAATGDIGVTETFFNLYPRYPHAIKVFFHLLQIVFLKAGGYSIFTFRLMSLLFGTGSLIFLYLSARRLFGSRKWALAAAAVLAVDVQFIYAAHFARQEIVILFLLLGGLYSVLQYGATGKRRWFALLCLMTGVSIGVHPNSFILALTLGCILLARVLLARDISWKALPAYIGSTALWAAGIVLVSLWEDPDFFAHYRQYGSRYEDVFATVSDKTFAFPYFLQKLFLRVSGTYYTPDIRPELILFPLLLMAGIFAAVKSPRLRSQIGTLTAGILGVFAGIILIGRYNQTSIVFVFPFFCLLGIGLLTLLKNRLKVPLAAVWILCTALSAAVNIAPWLQYDYQDYLQEIRRLVPADAKVIGNLNSDYAFENGELLDYRNLPYIRASGESFADYVKENGVRYIILSDELRLLYGKRPEWDGVYGDLSICNEIDVYTRQNCTVVGSFVNNTYGGRIVRYMNRADMPFGVTVYRVNE